MPRGTGAWTRFQILNAATSAPHTSNFRHLLNIPRWLAKRQNKFEPSTNFTKTKDRIKYWNIVPGDQIRLLGDSTGKIYQVGQINKLTNQVYLREENTLENPKRLHRGRNAPYSRCQLFIGRFEFPPEDGSLTPQTQPVFAKRVSTSSPFYAHKIHRFLWSRYAVATVPRLPQAMPGESTRIHIPWPKSNKPMPPDPTPDDTRTSVVEEVTYTPPSLPAYSFGGPKPVAPSEQEYIKSLRTQGENYDTAKPIEIFLSKELSNPHSRAKKQARWQAFQRHKRALLDQLVAAELKDLQGRTVREARAEAVWKWRQQLQEDRKAELKRRWKNRGMEARLARKGARKARKDKKQRERLRNLVLPPAPNQVIPESRA